MKKKLTKSSINLKELRVNQIYDCTGLTIFEVHVYQLKEQI